MLSTPAAPAGPCTLARRTRHRPRLSDRWREDPEPGIARGPGVFLLDPEGYLLTGHAGGSGADGSPALRGEHVASLFVGKGAARRAARAIRVAARRGRHVEEGGWVRADGTRFRAEVTTTALRDADGTRAGFAVVVRDVTRERAMARAVRVSEAWLAGIVSLDPDAVMSVDGAQRIVLFNHGAERIFGWRAEECLGRPLEWLIPEERRAAHRDRVHDLRGQGSAVRTIAEREEVLARRRNGEVFPAEASIFRVDSREGHIYTIVLRDLTDQRRAEAERAELLRREHAARCRAERAEARASLLATASARLGEPMDAEGVLRALVRSVVPVPADGCLACALDGDGLPARWEAAHRDPDGERLLRGYSGSAPDPADHPLARALRGAEPAAGAGMVEERSGVPGAHSTLAVPLVAHDRVLGAMLLLSEQGEFGSEDREVATELARRAALALDHARLYEEARQATRSRDEVLSIVSHDLRNPLNVVGLVTHVLRETLGSDAVAARHLDAIGRAADQMGRLILDLLDVSRLEAGALALDVAPVAPGVLVREAARDLAPLAAERSVALAHAVADDLPPVEADFERISQVFSNLVGNAVRFTPPGGRITLGAEPGEEGVVFRVEDTGAGIDAEHLPHLFDRFWQAHRTRRGGAGLGLAITQGIVEAHGGRIWVRSAPGEGSTFFFTLRQGELVPGRPGDADPAPGRGGPARGVAEREVEP